METLASDFAKTARTFLSAASGRAALRDDLHLLLVDEFQTPKPTFEQLAKDAPEHREIQANLTEYNKAAEAAPATTASSRSGADGVDDDEDDLALDKTEGEDIAAPLDNKPDAQNQKVKRRKGPSWMKYWAIESQKQILEWSLMHSARQAKAHRANRYAALKNKASTRVSQEFLNKVFAVKQGNPDADMRPTQVLKISLPKPALQRMKLGANLMVRADKTSPAATKKGPIAKRMGAENAFQLKKFGALIAAMKEAQPQRAPKSELTWGQKFLYTKPNP